MNFLRSAPLAVTKASSRSYHLAFNPRAKARPNFGQRGVGFYSSNVYCYASNQYILHIILLIPVLGTVTMIGNGVVRIVDSISGGGGVDLYKILFSQVRTSGFIDNSKPWNFVFPPGEGLAHGPPRYRFGQEGKEIHH